MTPAAAAGEAASKPAISTRAWLGFLLASILLVYYRTIHYPFFFDDWAGIVFNPRIQDWHQIPGYFTKHLWYHTTGDFRANYYRPLYLAWFFLNYQILGINPAGWRLTVLLLHCANVVLVFKIAKSWLQDERAALIAAAVFALHPVHIESMGWISAGGEPLAACALLLALLALMRWVEIGRARWLIACSGLFFTALLLKESTAVFPLFVFCFVFSKKDGARLQRSVAAIKAAAFFIPPAAVYFFLRAHALHGVKVHPQIDDLTALLTIPSVLWFYLQHLLLPIRLTFFNSLPYVSKILSPAFVLPTLAICLAVVLALRAPKQIQLAAAWVLTFLLLPIFGIWIFGDSMLVQDRYLYVPAVGFAFIVGYIWKTFASRSSHSAKTATAAAILLLAFYGAATFAQSSQWSSEEALYDRGLEIHPGSMVPESGIAYVHLEKGEYARAESMLRSLHSRYPADTELAWKLGMSLYLQKRYTEAIPIWQQVIANSLVSAFHDAFLARAYFQIGDFEPGVAAMTAALAVTPEDTSLRLELANDYLQHGDRAAAIAQYKAVLVLRPDEKILQDYVRRLEASVAPVKAAPAR
jgi:tetratricopeptide (TPR) repeat protein